jgi:hypothetical protein
LGDLTFDGVSIFSRLTTGGDIARDGSRLVIRTYTHAYEWELAGAAPDKNWWLQAPRKWLLPSEKQGEAIAYAPDNRTLLCTSEKIPAPLDEIEPEATASR